MENAIEIKELRKIYSRAGTRPHEALKSIDLKVEKGEIAGFLGPNGAGKTTTIKIIAGLVYPTSGAVSVFGRNLSDYAYRRSFGYLPERPCFYENLTGMELLEYYGKFFGLSKKERRIKAERLLEEIGLKEWAHSPVRIYSQGMNQKLGLAQALVGDPRLLILDEPMSVLDPLSRRQVRQLLLDLKQKGTTVFFSSHILYDVEMLCDRAVIIKSGKILLDMDIASLVDRSILGYEIVADAVTKKAEEELRRLGVSFGERLGSVYILADNAKKAAVIEVLYLNRARLVSLAPQKQSLEDAFIEEVARSEVKQ